MRQPGDARDRLAEADRVEGDRDRLGQEQHQPERAAELDAQRARDQVVVAAALDPQVGRDRRERDAGQDRDRVGHQDDDQRSAEAGGADHEAQPQEEDDAEDREDARREDAGEGAELALGRGG